MIVARHSEQGSTMLGCSATFREIAIVVSSSLELGGRILMCRKKRSRNGVVEFHDDMCGGTPAQKKKMSWLRKYVKYHKKKRQKFNPVRVLTPSSFA